MLGGIYAKFCEIVYNPHSRFFAEQRFYKSFAEADAAHNIVESYGFGNVFGKICFYCLNYFFFAFLCTFLRYGVRLCEISFAYQPYKKLFYV